jgi:hypothetical protein
MPYPIPGIKLEPVQDNRHALNDSEPAAEDGCAALAYCTKLRNQGHPLKAAWEMTKKRFGEGESIIGISRAMGQDPFRRAVKAGKVYAIPAIGPDERVLHEKAGEDAQTCLRCGEHFSLLAIKCPRCGGSV